MRFLIINFYLIFLLVGCNNKDKNNLETSSLSILKDSLDVDTSVFSKILILQDRGCLKCNVKLYDFINESRDGSILFIYSGLEDDFISNLSEINIRKNIILDKKQLFYKYNLINNSSGLIIKNDKVDTLLTFSKAEVFDQNFEYFLKN